jgi:hypothetical protein
MRREMEDATSEATLFEYLESQDELVREAALALPHQFSHCTHALGYIRFISLNSESSRAN